MVELFICIDFSCRSRDLRSARLFASISVRMITCGP